jgi:hypothetical protein
MDERRKEHLNKIFDLPHGDIKIQQEAPTCPHCWGEMERFEGLPVKLVPDRPARQNVGWYCPTCRYDVDEGWINVQETSRGE